jgi:hypothetical protein
MIRLTARRELNWGVVGDGRARGTRKVTLPVRSPTRRIPAAEVRIIPTPSPLGSNPFGRDATSFLRFTLTSKNRGPIQPVVVS